MITEIISDIINSVSNVFQGSSLVEMVMLVVISIYAGLRMNSSAAIFGWVFEGTVLFGFLLYLWSWLHADDRFTFGVWEAKTVQAWDAMLGISMRELIGYFALFFILILAVHLVKRVARG